MTLQPAFLRTSLALLLPLALVTAGCDLGDKSLGDEVGNDTGDDQGDGDGDGDGDTEPGDTGTTDGFDGDCGEETVTVITDPSAALPGFDLSAADLLANAEGSFAGEFSWNEDDGPITIAHAGTTSALTVTVAYQAGEIRLTEVEKVGEWPDGDAISLCSNTVEIDVSMTFSTADGVFAETFALPLLAGSHGYEDGDEPEPGLVGPGFYHSLDMAALQGTLSLDDFSFTDAEISDLVLSGSFDAEGLGGSLSMEVLTMDWVGFGSVASFSAAPQP